jgi:hypothetical protein
MGGNQVIPHGSRSASGLFVGGRLLKWAVAITVVGGSVALPAMAAPASASANVAGTAADGVPMAPAKRVAPAPKKKIKKYKKHHKKYYKKFGHGRGHKHWKGHQYWHEHKYGHAFDRDQYHHEHDFKKHDFNKHDFNKHDFKKHDFNKHDFDKHDFKKDGHNLDGHKPEVKPTAPPMARPSIAQGARAIDSTVIGENEYIAYSLSNGTTWIGVRPLGTTATPATWHNISNVAGYPGRVVHVALDERTVGAPAVSSLHVAVLSANGTVARTLCQVDPAPGVGTNPAWPGNCSPFSVLTTNSGQQ